jgi:hypothetical protein
MHAPSSIGAQAATLVVIDEDDPKMESRIQLVW